MYDKSLIPPSILNAQDEHPDDEQLLTIRDIEGKLEEAERETRYLKADLDSLKEKRRKEIKIPWKDSAEWCLAVDANNFSYFLKSSMGVANCVAYKYKVEVDAEIKNKIASALSFLYLKKTIGRARS